MKMAAFRAMLLIISADMTIILRLARTIGAKPSAISCGISMYGFNIIFLKCPRPSADPVASVVCSAAVSSPGGSDSATVTASTSANPRIDTSEPETDREAFIVRVVASKKTLTSGGSGDSDSVVDGFRDRDTTIITRRSIWTPQAVVGFRDHRLPGCREDA